MRQNNERQYAKQPKQRIAGLQSKQTFISIHCEPYYLRMAPMEILRAHKKIETATYFCCWHFVLMGIARDASDAKTVDILAITSRSVVHSITR